MHRCATGRVSVDVVHSGRDWQVAPDRPLTAPAFTEITRYGRVTHHHGAQRPFPWTIPSREFTSAAHVARRPVPDPRPGRSPCLRAGSIRVTRRLPRAPPPGPSLARHPFRCRPRPLLRLQRAADRFVVLRRSDLARPPARPVDNQRLALSHREPPASPANGHRAPRSTATQVCCTTRAPNQEDPT